ncbi:MAG: hypothetical protein DWB99_01350 [Candidatus Poseidoniales archaeon]|nr:MAG: hypothetical protein DWB99_01350 [Candidatus Poseidoniales archaeon]|tara:strand:+ start:922 stop:1239 length:318 start_codon:yes stop_codon:yes gene_type:complete
MSKVSFVERLTAMDKPDEVQETEQIWRTVRSFLGLMRVIIFILIIAIAELMEEFFIGKLSLAIWSLIVGIPLFILLSVLIIMGNGYFLEEEKKKTAVLRPILKRQ